MKNRKIFAVAAIAAVLALPSIAPRPAMATSAPLYFSPGRHTLRIVATASNGLSASAAVVIVASAPAIVAPTPKPPVAPSVAPSPKPTVKPAPGALYATDTDPADASTVGLEAQNNTVRLRVILLEILGGLFIFLILLRRRRRKKREAEALESVSDSDDRSLDL